ncbi:MAG: hypothetical protein AVDCRST_MAG86-3543 [uncultured Truepera sp.]|uniref:Uncharacterized protein n=1 Tax=uncultured Truepera sp. TaxID=543023 RepID=A0A6J4VNQ3_9DEIN|nr:MAG: hypothetical protein AVDCRST_MAG86-3543 [uncultured Truepera sp.]
MAQLTLDLDADTASKVRRAAEREGLSQDEWVSQLIKVRLAAVWPDSVVRLAGTWPDFEAESVRQRGEKDTPRETL